MVDDRKQVVVFGAGRGIGRAIAEAFAQQGDRVVGFDREFSPTESRRDSVEWKVGDVLNDEDIRQVKSSVPRIDHVVFAIGLGSGSAGSPFWNVPRSSWHHVIAVNLLGAVNVAYAFAPSLAEQRSGSMTFLVSVAGQIGSPTDPPYSAAKAGLINFMQVVARDLAPYGVRANAISPGMVKTELNRSVWQSGQKELASDKQQDYDAWAAEKLRRVCPLGRWQTADEIAAMAVYLASDKARNITGQTINIDGGQVMHS